jgi:hypothetical protein
MKAGKLKCQCAHLFDLLGLEVRLRGVSLDFLHDTSINVILVEVSAAASNRKNSLVTGLQIPNIATMWQHSQGIQ